MKRLLPSACIGILIALASATRADQEAPVRIVLHEGAVVAGETFRLCDVADVPDGMPAEVRDLSLGNSPWAGCTRRVTRGLVVLRMLAAGLDPARYPFAGPEACIVERATTSVPSDRIVAAGRELLLAQFAGNGADVQVELLHEVAPMLVPPTGGEVELRASVRGAAAPTGTVRVDVDLVRDGVRLRKVPLSFAVRLDDRVAVAKRGIAAGEALTEANVSFARRDVAGIGAPCFRSVAALHGKVAARPIQPGQPITHRVVAEPERPYVIGPNQRVHIVLETPTLRVVTMGVSLGRAREGEAARARNLNTGREVVGIASADSTIRVTLGGEIDD